jgi:hypothetical protein
MAPPLAVDDGGRPLPGADPESVFAARALPVLLADCRSCHATAADPRDAPDFLLPEGSEYDNVRPLITAGDPAGSLLMQKGRGDVAHDGTGFIDPNDAREVEAWILAEGGGPPRPMEDAGRPPVGSDAGGGSATLRETDPIVIGEDRMVSFDLGPVGAPFEQLTFYADMTEGGLQVGNVRIIADATGGAVFSEPQLIIHDPSGEHPDEADRFASEVTVPAGRSVTLASVFSLPDFPAAGGSISVRFDRVLPLDP